MGERLRRLWGIGKQSDYVTRFIHSSNMRAAIYMAFIVICLEIWMVLSLASNIMESAAAGKPRDFMWIVNHGAWYVVLLAVAAAVLIHAIRYMRGKTFNMRVGNILLVVFSVACLVFGIHFGNNSYVKGDQILAFVTMTLFVFGMLVWKPVPVFIASIVTFGGFYLYIDHNLPANYSLQVNLFTLWISTVVVALAAYNQQLSEAHKSEDIKRVNERLRHIASFDELTGMPNMHSFNGAVNVLFEGIGDFDIQYSILYMDIEHFKAYNDKHGFGAGDCLLQDMAHGLLQIFADEMVARFSDDHFVAICESRVAEERAAAAQEVLKGLRGEVRLHLKTGIYKPKMEEGINVSQACDKARYACNEIKKRPGVFVNYFDNTLDTDVKRRQHIINNIKRAASEGWIKAYYQPVVRCADGSGELCGYEALARWIDPQYGFLSPGEFIPVLEKAEISYKLDLHMVDCVLDDICTKQDMGIPVVPVSVNFSVNDLVQIDIAAEVSRRADERGIDHKLLVVELTESAASSNPELLKEQVRSLHEAGFDVWMDDFGSGYSSLNTLQEFDFDLIKLDMEFVHGLEGDYGERAQAVVSSVLYGMSRMGLDTLAEGVETNSQAQFLQNAGCNMLQGYLLCRPTSLEDILKSTAKNPREHYEEFAYWDSVGRANLVDLCEVKSADIVGSASLAERPMGVVELRENEWRVLRANDSYRVFLRGMGIAFDDGKRMLATTFNADLLDPEFPEAAERSVASGAWERIAGSLERGTGYQFYVRHIASSMYAKAFAVSSVPTLLGNALGGFGDVPVAYSVCRAVFDDARERIVDVAYAYANQMYLDAVGAKERELVGHSILERIENVQKAKERWYPYCRRAILLGETVHDVVYSPEIDHWLSFSIAPCSVEDYYVFAFTMADAEQREREKLTVSLDTADLIIDIADAFSGEASYDVAMSQLLAALSRIAHAKRVSLIEREPNALGVAFEWCDEDVEPLIGVMQGLKDVEFDVWDRLTASGPLIVPDVYNSEGIDRGVLDMLAARGITCMMVVPVKSDNVSLGYLVIDNYELDDDLDVIRLMESVASFVATRMVNHRLVGELRRNSQRDALTGILNRRGIDLAISKQMADRPGERFVLALMDIDDFKAVNDVHGHDVGDEALRSLAQAILESFPSDAIVGRNGGDEFLVMLYGYGMDEAGRMIGDLLARNLSCTLNGKCCHLSMSAGYASYPDQANDLMGVYRKADQALYAVKLKEKSGCRAYSPDVEGQYRMQLGFTPRDIAASVPGAIVVSRYSHDWETLFVNEEALRLFECDDFADYMRLSGGTFVSVMHPDDIQRVHEELDAQIGTEDNEGKSFVTYRVVTKNKEVRNVLGSGRLVDVEGLGRVYYELIVNIDECRQAGACMGNVPE